MNDYSTDTVAAVAAYEPFVPAEPFATVIDEPAPLAAIEPAAALMVEPAGEAPLSEERTCVVCGRAFNPFSRERCSSRPAWCSRCCPHPDDNANCPF